MSISGRIIRTLVAILAVSALLSAQGTLTASPKSVTLRAAAGQFSPLSLNILLNNTGSAPVAWEAATTASWLKLPVASGTATPGNNAVTIQAIPAAFYPGGYVGTVRFSAAGSSQTLASASVSVRLEIDAAAPVSGPVTINLASSPIPYGLPEPRAEARATVLSDGRVLITGGGDSSDLTTVVIYDGFFGSGVKINTPRRRHTATLLANGDVLVAGGLGGGFALASTELFRSGSTDSFVPASPMLEGRYYHAAVRLADKRVLVAGGIDFGGQVLASTELYDPATGKWQSGPPLNVARTQAAITLLADGRVLLSGGTTADGTRTATAEILDPAVAGPSWRPAAPMSAARQQHTATLLPKGQVLVAGGWDGAALSSTEIYDPAADAWTAGPALAAPRYDHNAFLLPAGVVFIFGGWQDGTGVAATETEVYNPAGGDAAGAIAPGGSIAPRVLQAAALLANGQVLNAGGVAMAGAWRLSTADLISIEALQTTIAGALTATPASVGFSLPAPVHSQTITLSNAGTGTLTWTAAIDQPWVSLDNTLGTVPSQVTVTVNPAGLAPGTYQANLMVVSPEAGNSPLAVPITVEIRAPTVLVLSAQSFEVDAVSGTNPQPQILQVTNGGGGTLTWSAASNAKWLAPDSSSGTAPSTVILNLNTSMLLFGVYQAQITFTSKEAINSPQVVNVTVRVLRAPQVGLARSSLDVLALPGRDPDPITVNITNTTGVPVAWTAASSQSWLVVSSGGTAPGAATIQITSHDLPVGKYDAEIVFTAPGASNSPRSLFVYLEVRPGFEPALSIFLNTGFYIAEATLDRGAASGWWGMEVSTAKGKMNGGFILGGPLWATGEQPATCTFSVPSRQRLAATVIAQAMAGSSQGPFGFDLRFKDSAGKQVGKTVPGAPSAQLSLDLDAGTYTAEVRSTAGSLVGSYQMTLAAPFLGKTSSTGYLVPNAVGFGAFYLAEAQTVTIRLLAHQDSGSWGAGDMVLTLKDASRRVLRIVDRYGTRNQ